MTRTTRHAGLVPVLAVGMALGCAPGPGQAEGAKTRCRPGTLEVEVIARNRYGALMRGRDGVLFACRRIERPREIGSERARNGHLRGRYVAWSTTCFCADDLAYAVIHRLDLATGRSTVVGPAIDSAAPAAVRRLVVSARGAVAWIAFDTTVAPPRSRLLAVDSHGTRTLLDDGELGSSLRLDAGTLTWTNAGVRRSAQLG